MTVLTKNQKQQEVVLKVNTHKGDRNVYSTHDKSYYLLFKNIGKLSEMVIETDNFLDIQEEDINYYAEKGKVVITPKRISKYKWGQYKEQIKEFYYIDRQEELHQVVIGYLNLIIQKENEKRRKEGFINYKYPMTGAEIKANLSILLTPKVINYIGDGQMPVFGYFGHSFRQHYMDEYIESRVKKLQQNLQGTRFEGVDVLHILAEWLCQGHARHWMDSVESSNRTQFKNQFKELYHELLIRTNYDIEDLEGFDKVIRRELNIERG